MRRLATCCLALLCLLAALTWGPVALAADGPVASWPIEKVGATGIVDATGNGHDLTVTGASAETSMGRAFPCFPHILRRPSGGSMCPMDSNGSI